MRFGDFPESFCAYETSRVVLLPIPFDKTSSWIKGADKGPEAILNASPALEWYDIETGVEVYREGIHTAPPIFAETPEEMVQAGYAQVKRHAQAGKFVVTLGGEHSVTLGPVRALAEACAPLSVLHLDAHGDTRDTYEGSPYNHACIMARVKECAATTVSVGIRSIDASEARGLPPERTFYAHHLRHDPEWQARVVDLLGGNVYVTIDLDVFDPSILPATGTPEPGGLGWYEVMDLLAAVARSRRIVGFDVVELCPMGHPPSEFLAAKLIYGFLSHIRAHHAWGRST